MGGGGGSRALFWPHCPVSLGLSRNTWGEVTTYVNTCVTHKHLPSFTASSRCWSEKRQIFVQFKVPQIAGTRQGGRRPCWALSSAVSGSSPGDCSWLPLMRTTWLGLPSSIGPLPPSHFPFHSLVTCKKCVNNLDRNTGCAFKWPPHVIGLDELVLWFRVI